MNVNLYFDLVIWLKRKEMRQDIDEWNRSIISIAHKQYEIQGSLLYQKKADNIIPIIREGNTNSIIKLIYDNLLAEHIGQCNTYFRLQGHAW